MNIVKTVACSIAIAVGLCGFSSASHFLTNCIGDCPCGHLVFNCHPAKHCCGILDCAQCRWVATCCPNIPGVCCYAGFDENFQLVAFCYDCDPV